MGAQSHLVHALFARLFLFLIISFRVRLHVVQTAIKVALHLNPLAVVLVLSLGFSLVVLPIQTQPCHVMNSLTALLEEFSVKNRWLAVMHYRLFDVASMGREHCVS